MNQENTLIILGKYPRNGWVNTRLSPALSAEQASSVHLACLQSVCRQARALESWMRVIFAGTPDEDREAFGACLGGWSDRFGFRPQGAGSLGERLDRLFGAAFDEGADKVVAIGTDSPHRSVAAVPEALVALDGCDVVIGPAEDGGYYLIGLGRPCVEVFRGIDWGSDRVSRQTLERVEALGLRVKVLEVGYDLDRPADVSRLMDDLASVDEPAALVDLRETMKAILSEKAARPGGPP